MHTTRRVYTSIRNALIVAICGAIIGALFASTTKVNYQSSISFTVNEINKQDTTQYQYDGYYALQASDLFSDTIVSWFQTPSFLLDIYTLAKVDPVVKSLDSFTSRFKMRKYSSQNLVLKFTAPDESTAKKLSAAIVSHVEEESQQLNQNAHNEALFQVVGSQPVIVKSQLTVTKGILYGFVAGILLFVFAAALIGSFKKLDSETTSNG